MVVFLLNVNVFLLNVNLHKWDINLILNINVFYIERKSS